MATTKSINKMQDTFNDKKSSADLVYTERNARNLYKMLRRTKNLPQGLSFGMNTATVIGEKYCLRGFQFGNWVTTEDRFNYLASFYLCLFDLQKVLKFKGNNLGLNGQLGIALGSRGVPRALAHYEPYNNVINISRYKREDVLKKEIEDAGGMAPVRIPKEVRFIHTGGVGSFSHEYGHFLDYNFGVNIEKSMAYPFLTGKPGSVSRVRIEYPEKFVMRNLVEDLFEGLFLTNGKPSAFDNRLRSTGSAYLNNRQEVFARVFEHYVHYKLIHVHGLKNDFMTKPKYQKIHYLTDKELLRVIPILDNLVSEFRKFN